MNQLRPLVSLTSESSHDRIFTNDTHDLVWCFQASFGTLTTLLHCLSIVSCNCADTFLFLFSSLQKREGISKIGFSGMVLPAYVFLWRRPLHRYIGNMLNMSWQATHGLALVALQHFTHLCAL